MPSCKLTSINFATLQTADSCKVIGNRFVEWGGLEQEMGEKWGPVGQKHHISSVTSTCYKKLVSLQESNFRVAYWLI